MSDPIAQTITFRTYGTCYTATHKTAIQRQLDATDRQIDNLVYELYELTDDEIKIVEEATRGSVPRPSGSGPSASESGRASAKGRSLTLAVLNATG